ncbi:MULTISPECIES: hypothetical protein [unclassified Pseudomonas]|uniref:hypothetical protein n=1 Tax=unclassified Pseudomonas TaxID=196821 RepID=UPI00200D6C1F|nr:MULTISPECIES: hypothetical protein [unclassified Pseudomonas]
MKRSPYWLGLLAALSLPSAEAVNQEIRALFQPDPMKPNKNVFINKTPNSGYCALWPDQCADNQMFSIELPVRFSSSRFMSAGFPLSLKVPANWRQLTVTNPKTQETETVEVRITGIGSDFELSDTAANLVGVSDILEGHQKLWTSSSWVYAPSPCQYSGVGSYSPSTYRFFWKTPVEAACTKVAAYIIPGMVFRTIDFAYELRTPNPLGMSTGLYTGSLTYTLGPGGDFDLGMQMYPDDNNLTLDFVLDVQHTLRVELPPGGNKITLEPEGGWQRWLDSGQKPTRVYRDQPFYISASTRFKMQMYCSEAAGGPINNGCLMRSPSTNKHLTFYPRLTLPAGIVDGYSGGNVNRVPLFHSVWSPFLTRQYVDRGQGMLHFELDRNDLYFLLQPGMSDTFHGGVLVSWDSEI